MSPSVREEPIVISSFDVGASGKLEAAPAMRHFQEAASHRAMQLGVGIEQLARQHIFWVLSHLQMRAVRWPEMNEEVIIQTWPKALKGLYTTRDFLLLDRGGKALIKATSAWIMVNAERKRPIRPAGWINPQAFVPDKNAITMLRINKAAWHM